VLPEREAIDVVAKTVGDLLASSGCKGPRVARVDTPPPPNPTNPTNPDPGPTKPPITTVSNPVTPTNPPGVTDAQRQQAEDVNHQGSDKLRAADIAGAIADFQQALATVPDPKYAYNLCLALEAQTTWDQATAACKQAKSLSPDAKLGAKIDHRLDLLAHHQ
jgi:tetratricopeptide (TPR) repeat protein